jgi:2-hydroxychromene-2-carboxylate isomerase
MWLEERDIADRPTIEAILRSHVPDPAAVLARAGGPEVEAEFDANTRDAIAANVFGVPAWVLADGELFWGQDRIELLDLALARQS